MDAAGISSATPRCGVTCSCWEPPSVACARLRNFTLQASARYTGAHIGGLKHGALGIAFRGYFHANPALLRLGDDFLRAVASWRRTSPEPPPWLNFIPGSQCHYSHSRPQLAWDRQSEPQLLTPR